MKLWGHTSSVSSAEITPRGKAVSVSTRGNELRVWELEGGLSSTSTSTSSSSTSTSTSTSQFFSSLSKKRIKRLEDRSVQIRPEPRPFISSSLENQRLEEMRESEEQKYEKEIEGRKRWVGFDDEMVIVLKESGRGTQALMIYDFT
jgi:WD40 repeat protein